MALIEEERAKIIEEETIRIKTRDNQSLKVSFIVAILSVVGSILFFGFVIK